MIGDRFRGLLYRAINPLYAREPLSGRGAGLYGGRFNPKGTDALYAALAPETAIREASQAGTLQPTTLVAYNANIRTVFDARDPDALTETGMADAAMADPAWRDAMRRDGMAPTQWFAANLIDRGFAGLLVRSFARGSGPDDLNLVLWRWNTGERDVLEVVDDEGRLAR